MITFAIMLHRSDRPGARQTADDAAGLSRAEQLERLARLTSYSDEDASSVRRFAKDYEFELAGEYPAFRSFEFRARAVNVDSAFGIRLQTWRAESTEFISYDGPVSLPRSVSYAIASIIGLDSRPIVWQRKIVMDGSGGVR
jgi:Pro-kumamolisin, activation domain